MKLFGKLLTGMLGIILLSFAVFGTVLLQASFQTALDREKESGLEEARMLSYAMLAAAEGLEESYEMDERLLAQLAESVASNVGDSRNRICVYNEKGQSIYPSGRQAGALYDLLVQNTSGGENITGAADTEYGQTEDIQRSEDTGQERRNSYVWWLTEHDGTHAMEILMQMECAGNRFYMEIHRELEYIYEDRAVGWRNYRAALFALAAFSAVLCAVFSVRFTAPIRKLSLATRAFSRGNYGKRVTVSGNDEITLLMRDFNGMAEQLEHNIHELEEHARRQEEFTGAFAHELKTPLTSIIGYGEMLMTRELDAADRRQCADYIYREGRRLERLSYKMMELIRIGKMGADAVKVQAEELGGLLEQSVRTKLSQKNIDLRCEFEGGTIWGDLDLLISLFGNLVDNSFKACSAGGQICVHGQVETAPQENGRTIGYRITVSDNGRGMPTEEIGKITEAFYMIDKSRARREGGAGLGMAICGRIVEAHGASWEIVSAPGEGTKVTVHFPKREAAYE